MLRKVFLGWLIVNFVVAVPLILFFPAIRVYLILLIVAEVCWLALDATSGVSSRR